MDEQNDDCANFYLCLETGPWAKTQLSNDTLIANCNVNRTVHSSSFMHLIKTKEKFDCKSSVITRV